MYFINPNRNARFWHENVFYRVREKGHLWAEVLRFFLGSASFVARME